MGTLVTNKLTISSVYMYIHMYTYQCIAWHLHCTCTLVLAKVKRVDHNSTEAEGSTSGGPHLIVS